MSLLDKYAPVPARCERGDHSWCEHAGPELPIMDGPYGDAADHAGHSWLTADDGEDYSETLSAEFARIARTVPAGKFRAARIERHRTAMIRAGREPHG